MVITAIVVHPESRTRLAHLLRHKLADVMSTGQGSARTRLNNDSLVAALREESRQWGKSSPTTFYDFVPYAREAFAEARASLYSTREAFGERSPESWAALRVWEALEEIELSSRPERQGA